MSDEHAKTAFGRALARLRADRGLSTQGLADALAAEGIARSKQAVSQWEAGADPGRQVVVGLERALNAPGELLPLLGYSLSDESRVEQLERRVEELTRIVELLQRRR